MAKVSAQETFDKEMAYRRGVMSILFKEMKNQNANVDFVDIHNIKLTHVGGVSGHFISLTPIQQGTIPDAWELHALQSFEHGNTEVYSVESMGNQRIFRYIRPLYLDGECLQCHGGQGLKPGGRFGGISVEVKWEPVMIELRSHIMFDFLIYTSIWVLGLIGIWVTWLFLNKYLIRQKQTEEDLRLAIEKKEEGNRLKEAFIYNISHELRTPLNGILGFSNMIIEPDISDEERSMCNTYIKTSSDRLLNTITNYMDISMIVSGTFEIHRNPFAVYTILDDIKEQFLPVSKLKNIEFTLKTDETIHNIVLNSDAEMLRKILSHLIDNAIKFTATGGVTFGCTLTSGKLRFYVQDTGIGVPEEARTRIFDHFVQEELSMSRSYEGSGLGLSIAQGLANILGSQIQLESTKGQGSLFYFMLHIGDEEIVTPAIKPKKEKTGQRINPFILIAEDDLSNFEFMESILLKTGAKVLGATNGQEAVDLCRQYPEISLVLMDIRMPIKDGLQATREIKAIRENLPIVIITAFAMNDDEKRAREAGCDDYLAKPTSKESLMQLLEKMGI